jgi:hypothetical protein
MPDTLYVCCYHYFINNKKKNTPPTSHKRQNSAVGWPAVAKAANVQKSVSAVFFFFKSIKSPEF